MDKTGTSQRPVKGIEILLHLVQLAPGILLQRRQVVFHVVAEGADLPLRLPHQLKFSPVGPVLPGQQFLYLVGGAILLQPVQHIEGQQVQGK